MTKEKAIDLFCSGRKEDAYKIFKSLADSNIEDADIFCHLAILEENKGNFAEAIDCYSKALKLKPDLVPALANLGNQLKNSGHLNAAADNLRKASELSAGNSLICSNYANVLVSMGEHKAAYKEYLKSLEMMSQNFNAFSNFLLSLHYTEEYSPEEIFRFHTEFSERLGEIEEKLPFYNHSKLKIGYVSGDFKRHSVAYFIEGILHFHNREKFEIFCYSDVVKPDLVTEKFKKMDLTFRNIKPLSDKEVHGQIKDDEIDILVDLGGHTGKRLQVFAMRSAAVQISYLGYGNTTGLKNMDYRIVDFITDDETSRASEKLIRLKRPFIAFCPPENSPEIINTPAIENGFITFGSFNNLPKLTDEVLRLWIRILKKVPQSRIILKTRGFIDEEIKKSMLRKFTSRGIEAERVILLGYESTLDDHLLNYRKIDIALDPFPYNGTTTSCEALHMSVPVICLLGSSHISRVSASILEQTGLGTLIAENKNEYVNKVVQLASDKDFLNSLHLQIRNMMQQSKLCDSKDLTERLEEFYVEAAKRPAEASLL